MMVNHNCYTNFKAKKSFEYFLELCRRYPEKCAELGIDAEFLRARRRSRGKDLSALRQKSGDL